MAAFILSPIALAALMLSLSGWGRLVAPRLDWPARYGAGTLLVFGAVSALGWAGLLRPEALWPLALVGLLFGVRHIRDSIPAAWKPVLAAAALLLPLAALPPMSRDAMNHHLYLPGLWLQAGRIYRPEWAHFFSYPNLVETLYTLVGGTGGLRLGRLVSLSGLLASVACAARMGGGGKRGAAAVVVLLSIPEVLRNATWAFSDTYLILFSLLALRELTDAKGSRWRAMLWAAAGGCCKYNGVLLIPLVAVAVLARGRSWSRREAILAAAAVVLPSLSWFLPNLLEWGNPVYPRLAGLLGGVERSARASGLMAAYGEFTASLRGIEDVLLLPLRISVGGEWDNPRLFDGSSGPLLLAGVLLSLVTWRRRGRAGILLPVAYLVAAQLLLGSAVRVRYLLPGLAMLSVRAADGICDAALRGRRSRLLVLGLAVICLGWSSVWLARLYGDARPWAYRGDRSYLEESLPYARFYSDCEGALEDDDLTLLVNMGNRGHYFPGRTRFDPERFPMTLLELFWAGASAEEAVVSLRGMGVTHMALNMSYTVDNLFVELDSATAEEAAALFARWGRPLVVRGPYCLLRLEADAGDGVRGSASPVSSPEAPSRR